MTAVRVGAPAGPPHALDAAAVAALLETDPEQGLAPEDAAQRLARAGPNRPERARRPSYARLLLAQVADPLVALLLAATVVSFAIGDTLEAATIAGVLVLNGALGFWQELKAERAILALSEGFTQTARVVREGAERQLPAEEVVPGDVLVVRAGDRIAADVRVVSERALEVDESALTGESLPVAKRVERLPPETPLAERASMAYAGTGVTRGRGRAIVVATGSATELGQVEALAAGAAPPKTPLERRLARLARELAAAGVVLTAALTGASLLGGDPLHEAFLIGVAVAVAAVPEGLAATVTAALALGAHTLARRGAIVRRLDAVETLGETTVVCTDKTGTLTENELRVAGVRPVPHVDERDVLAAALLASGPLHADAALAADPVEAALVLAAAERGLSHAELHADRSAVHEIPFDAELKRSTAVWADARGSRVYTKGAPEVVATLAAGDGELAEAAAAWAGEGFRVLAVAARALPPAAPLDGSVEEGLELLGLVALHDPLRPSAAAALDEARRAGIAVRMLTGDHPATARTIGRALGLDPDAVVARATPLDKLALVESLQAQGEIVAVTGDGVNDAPALRRADVGVAMGRGGTEAARQAAAVVLTDDDFATILAAVAEGRRVGDNVRKFVAFLLSANLGEVLLFAVAIVAGLGTPLAVVQVLLVNLVTDGLPALALASDPVDGGTMRTAPRRGDRLFGGRAWLALVLLGVVVGGAALAAFAIGRGRGDGVAETMAFATVALGELALVFGIRSPVEAAWRLPWNRWLGRSVALSAAVVAAVVYVPGGHDGFSTVALSTWQAAIVLGLASLPLVAVEAAKAIARRLAGRNGIRGDAQRRSAGAPMPPAPRGGIVSSCGSSSSPRR